MGNCRENLVTFFVRLYQQMRRFSSLDEELFWGCVCSTFFVTFSALVELPSMFFFFFGLPCKVK